ncbi:xylulokinase [Halocella sp. SP3-1]|uniref:xylulokinase n=1 Tax=Halocella sp. SP3-1 TaxID=2382161 RepID=UPI000F75DC6D|nr:xylulokinase [Halocella sp. SP3-1]AZO93828.1 xylulokinase [Halocella sp. SP3-1]
MAYLMGLDIGTSGIKALLIKEDGQIVSSQTEKYPLHTPQAGWAEQNPADWWEATLKVISSVVKDRGVEPAGIKGISLSGQMHSSVFLNKDMKVVRPAILWSDTRTSRQCQQIYDRAGGLENLINYVSNPALEGFTAPKILWLKDNEPANYQQVSLVLLPKDYIRYHLTGEIFTEVSDAAGTLLLNVKEKKWSAELLKKLDISPEILPPVIDSIDIAGRISKNIADKTGLKQGTPVIAGGADNACGAVGSGIIQEGRVMVSIGTSGVVMAQANKPTADKQGRMHLFNHAVPDNWYMMGVMLSAGMSFNWVKEKLFDDTIDYDRLNQLAAAVEPGSDGLVFLPYLYGERTPHADANARGVYFGISGKHEQGHFIRSVMEGVTFGLRDSLELIKAQGIKTEEIRAIGGGAKSQLWQQIMADIFGQEICLLNIEEGPAFGAALIAGVGAGVYDNFATAESRIIKISKRISPVEENVAHYNKLYNIYQNLYPAVKDNYRELSKLN